MKGNGQDKRGALAASAGLRGSPSRSVGCTREAFGTVKGLQAWDARGAKRAKETAKAKECDRDTSGEGKADKETQGDS